MLQHDSQLLIPPEQRSGRGLRAARAKAAKRPDTTTSLVFNGFVLTTNVIPAHGASQGGDWCEAIPVSDSIVALSIGDVCGHGASAVPMMMIMRQLARDAVDQGMKPGQILSHLNAALCTDEAPTYVTAILALLDTRLRKLTFANAGHPPPLITTGPLSQWFLGPPQGWLPLGIEASALSPAQTIGLPASALVVFYTDGVVERKRDVLRGLSDLRNAAKFAFTQPELSAASVIEQQMVLRGPHHDDASILTARTGSLPPLLVSA